LCADTAAEMAKNFAAMVAPFLQTTPDKVPCGMISTTSREPHVVMRAKISPQTYVFTNNGNQITIEAASLESALDTSQAVSLL
jgi:hypothetical protein